MFLILKLTGGLIPRTIDQSKITNLTCDLIYGLCFIKNILFSEHCTWEDYFDMILVTDLTLRQLSHFASKYKGPSSMDYRERGSHARDAYSIQDNSRMGTSCVKEEEADTRIIAK